MTIVENRLITDFEIARLLGVSRSWVRKERMNRRRGLDHALTIDPVMVGTCPRYVASEVNDWMIGLQEARPAIRPVAQAAEVAPDCADTNQEAHHAY